METEQINTSNYKIKLSEIITEFKINLPDFGAFITDLESGLTENMSNHDFASYISETAAVKITVSNEYSRLAGVIMIKYLHNITRNSFVEKMFYIQKKMNIFKDDIISLLNVHGKEIESIIDYSRDYDINYFGVCSFIKSYIIKKINTLIERPQDVYMRLAIELHGDNLEMVKKTYDAFSLQYYTHGSPTLFNACYKHCQMASCYLMGVKEDSVNGIFSTLTDMITISKRNGGLGLHISNIRSYGSPLMTSGGFSKGIIPFIKIFNDALNLVNRQGARRSSACAIYLEPWHKDIFEFLDLRKNTGDEDMRAREMFLALWIPDLFMERVEKDDEWSLFDPNVAKGLHEVYGSEFKSLYHHYEKTKSRKVVRARNLWRAIITAQIETGTPYMLYKDTANRLSNQKNLGTIKSSNLCAEIIEYSDGTNVAVCNLASVCLPKCVKVSDKGEKYFDFELLKEVVGLAVVNMNIVIDHNRYPTDGSSNNNLKNRPIGIGIQGLADVFMMMRYPFESKEARDLNSKIFETMYYAAVEKSVELAKVSGCYDTFVGSDLSKGIFQFEKSSRNIKLSGMWDWESLRKEVMTYGVRNSLFIALMPTASTSQICGNSECFEPITSNLFTRRTLAGEFQCVNKFLMEDLKRLNLWNDEMRQLLIEYEGSVQNIPVIPEEIKNLYKTVWEIKMKTIIDLAADRQAFVDQSQSMNLFLKTPTYAQLTSTHFYGWKSGLITGMYYLRMVPVSSTIKFTIDKDKLNRTIESMKSENFNLKTTTTDNDSLLECEGCSL